MVKIIVAPIFLIVLQIALMVIYLDTSKVSLYSHEVQATAIIFIFLTTVLSVALLKKVWRLNLIWCCYLLITTGVGYLALIGYVDFSLLGGLAVGLLLLFLPVFKRDIPYFPSPSNKIAEVLGATDVEITTDVRIADLGAGFGRLGIQLANRYEAKVDCYEISPVCYTISKFLIKFLVKRGECRAIFASFWYCDFAEYDVVFNYLSPAVMERLAQKWQKEGRPGSYLVSYEFPVIDLEIASEIPLGRANLYVYYKDAQDN